MPLTEEENGEGLYQRQGKLYPAHDFQDGQGRKQAEILYIGNQRQTNDLYLTAPKDLGGQRRHAPGSAGGYYVEDLEDEGGEEDEEEDLIDEDQQQLLQ